MGREKRKRAATREGMIVTTVALDVDVHRRLAIAAIEDGTVMTELMRQAITEWLRARGRRDRDRSRRS